MNRNIYKNCTEKELIAGLREGVIACYEVLFHKYYPSFRTFVRGMVKDDMTADDITQNVFMKVWIHRSELNEALSMKNYLFVLSKNEVLNHFRAKHTMLLSLNESIAENSMSVKDEIENNYNLTQINQMVRKAVDKMPDKRRMVFSMSRFEYRSNKEIAQMTGLSVRTVDKHIELALRDIRKILEPFTFFLFLLISNFK